MDQGVIILAVLDLKYIFKVNLPWDLRSSDVIFDIEKNIEINKKNCNPAKFEL